MVTSIETLSKLERRVTFILSVSDVKVEIDRRLKICARQAKAPGFRPGKVPMRMIITQFGSQIEAEVLNDKVMNVFKDITEKNNLHVVGHPKIRQKINGDVLTFDAVFEIYPEIVIGDLSLIKVEKIISTITDTDIDKTIDILRKQRLQFYVKNQQDTHVNDINQLVKIGDRVTIDFIGKINGIAFQGSQANNFVFIFGEGHVPVAFENEIINLKIGESKQFLLKFPLDYYNKNVADKIVEFWIVLKKLECAYPLEIDAKFAKSLGILDGNLNKMRENIKHNLELAVQARTKARIKDNIMDALIKISNLEVPRILIEEDAERLTEIARQDRVQRSFLDMHSIKLSKDSFMIQAERRVRLGLIVAEISKIHKLAATLEQIKTKIEELAQNYKDPKKVLKYYANDFHHVAEIEALVLEDNVINYVLTQSKISEKVLMFHELMNHEQKTQLLFSQ